MARRISQKEEAAEGAVSVRLTDLISARGISKALLCRESGVSYRTILNIIEGKHRPYPQTAASLARALGCSTEYLIEGAGEKNVQRDLGPEWNAKPDENLIRAIETIARGTGLTREEVFDAYCELIRKKMKEAKPNDDAGKR
jgi:transcriptional regulator with XRE-family HTH domain